ncbi:MAG: protein kinase [Planctomycetota bacterium]
MDPARYLAAKQVLLDALDLPSERRAQFVEQRCGDDPALRAEVESLLQFADADSLPEPSAAFPERIGRYRILRELGIGGMGRVFEAEQDVPRRRVALKVMRGAIASPSLRRRFEIEAEILGRLEHRGIARIYDAGCTDGADPLPYLAMELIDGRELDDWLLAERPSRTRRLRVVIELAETIDYAHRQAIVHRDLKPSNVMIDATDQPKVLDFGIARALDRSAMETMLTRSGEMLGTLTAMSPEQLEGRPSDVRSDIYALGVIAYQVLAGAPPFDVAGLGLAAATQRLLTQPPRRLDDRDRTLRGDVSTVVHKAMARDPRDRYPSAADFAADLRAVVESRPVSARPWSARHRLMMFLARNRVMVWAASIAFVALGIGTAIALDRARAEHRARVAAEAAREDRSKILGFLLDTLRSSSPLDLGGDTPLRVLLTRAEAAAALRFAGRPSLLGELRQNLGDIRLSHGEVDAAATIYAQAVDDLRTAATEPVRLGNTLVSLGDCLRAKGDLEGAAARLDEAVALLVDRPGVPRSDQAAALEGQALICLERGEIDRAEAGLQRARSMLDEQDPASMPRIALILGRLAQVRMGARDSTKAREFAERAVEIQCLDTPRDRYDRTGLLQTLAWIDATDSRSDAAVARSNECLAIWSELVDGDHPERALALGNHAAILRMVGRHADAEPFQREAIAMFQRIPSTPTTVLAEHYRALIHLLDALGRREEAATWRARQRALEQSKPSEPEGRTR